MTWQRYRFKLNGHEPVEVQTAARDWATVVVNPNEGIRIYEQAMLLSHNAARRLGLDVPRHFAEFCDQLDGMPEALDDEDDEAMDPTPQGL